MSPQRVFIRPSSAAAGALPPSQEDAATFLNSEIGRSPGGPEPPPVVPYTLNSQSEYP